MADLVDRKELINALYEADAVTMQGVKIINQFPAADVEPVKRGRWLPQILLGTRIWDCSECKTIGSPVWKRCPVCEATEE